MKILVMEDDKKLAGLVRMGLEAQGFAVDFCDHGDDAYALATTRAYDALVLDIMVPGRDGLSILRNLRDQRLSVPVVIVTARSALNERLEGLNLGTVTSFRLRLALLVGATSAALLLIAGFAAWKPTTRFNLERLDYELLHLADGNLDRVVDRSHWMRLDAALGFVSGRDRPPAYALWVQRLISVFNSMLDRLEQAFHQARRFSADASHELKTPLALLQAELEQALQNLLNNAVKYNRAGGLIRVTLRTEAGVATVAVGNTGPGIPEQDRSRIFERFYRSDPARRRDRASGAGLGLSLSREIIRAHGGDLILGRNEGDWTELVVKLPLLPSADSLITT